MITASVMKELNSHFFSETDVLSCSSIIHLTCNSISVESCDGIIIIIIIIITIIINNLFHVDEK